MGDKDKPREKRNAIRQILMSEWDPTGVNDTPEAADEYDGYIRPLLDLLNAGASSDEVAEYLQTVEIERMGLTDALGNPLLPAQVRNAAVQSLRLLIPDGLIPKKVTAPKAFRHWNLFAKVISPAFARTQKRRNEDLCTGCGLNPCKCKNPKIAR